MLLGKFLTLRTTTHRGLPFIKSNIENLSEILIIFYASYWESLYFHEKMLQEIYL